MEAFQPPSQPSLPTPLPDAAEYDLWRDLLIPSAEADGVVDPVHLAYEQTAPHPPTSDLTRISEEDLMAATLLANSFAPVGEEGMQDPAYQCGERTRSTSFQNPGEQNQDEAVCLTPGLPEAMAASSSSTSGDVSIAGEHGDTIQEP